MGIKLSEKLYNRLPRVYRHEDGEAIPTPYPLKRYLEILGEGFDEVEGYIDDLSSIYDIDNCPPEILPLIGKTFGVDIPINNSMTVEMQRKFLKAVPSLLRLKGTEDSYKYLARELFGSEAKTSVLTNNYDPSITEAEWLELKPKLYVRIEADGENGYIATNLNELEVSFNEYAEIIRGVNKKLITQFSLYYRELYDIYSNFDDKALSQLLNMDSGADYAKTPEGIYIPATLSHTQSDEYNRKRLMDSITSFALSRETALNSKTFGLSSFKGAGDKIIFKPLVEQYQRLIKASDESKSMISFAGVDIDIFSRDIEGDSEVVSNVNYTRPSSLLTSTKLVTSFHTTNLNHYTTLNY